MQARDMEWLQATKITHVLNMTKELPIHFDDLFEYKRVPAVDADAFKLSKYFPEIIEFIEKGLKNGKVLVHCMMGVSRSATAVILYLVAKKGMKSSVARRFVKQKCPLVNPNKGFITQLINYELLNCKKIGDNTTLASRHKLITGGNRSPRAKVSTVDSKTSRGRQIVDVMKALVVDISQPAIKANYSCTDLKSKAKLAEETSFNENSVNEKELSKKQHSFSTLIDIDSKSKKASTGLIRGTTLLEFDRVFNKLLKRTSNPTCQVNSKLSKFDKNRITDPSKANMNTNHELSTAGSYLDMLANQRMIEKSKLELTQTKLRAESNPRWANSNQKINKFNAVDRNFPLGKRTFSTNSMNRTSMDNRNYILMLNTPKLTNRPQVELSRKIPNSKISSNSGNRKIMHSPRAVDKTPQHLTFNIYSRQSRMSATMLKIERGGLAKPKHDHKMTTRKTNIEMLRNALLSPKPVPN